MKNTAIAERQTTKQHHTEKMWKEETRTTADGQKLHVTMLAETTIDEHHDAETQRTIDIGMQNSFGTTRQGKNNERPNSMTEQRAMYEARKKRDAERRQEEAN